MRSMYRTLLRLSREVERTWSSSRGGGSSSSSTTTTTVNRHFPTWLQRTIVAENTALLSDDRLSSIHNVHDLRSYIRDTFRPRHQCDSTDSSTKERIAQGIEAVRSMEKLLHLIKNVDLEASIRDESKFLSVTLPEKEIDDDDDDDDDDEWVGPYVDRVDWLPSVLRSSGIDADGSPLSNKASNCTQILPLFPLSGPIHTSNTGPLPTLTKHSHWLFPTPGTEKILHISEPRYRRLYGDLLAETNTEKRMFLVPFCHPSQPGVFATHAFVYQLTGLDDISDETNGRWQYVCRHKVLHRPVRIHRVLNPQAYKTKEPYLQVEASWLDDEEAEKRVLDKNKDGDTTTLQILKALDEAAEVGVLAPFAIDECKAIIKHNSGQDNVFWPLLRTWLTGLQQRLLRLELRISARVKQALRAELNSIYDNHDDVRLQQRSLELMKIVQQGWRHELLQLKLDMVLSIPRVLQVPTISAKWDVLLDLIRQRTDRVSPRKEFIR